MKLRSVVQKHVEKYGHAATGKRMASDIKDLPKKEQDKFKKKGGSK